MSKRTHDDKKKPEEAASVFKIPNKEMILTRGKSTQLQRQLRNKDKSPKASPSRAQPQKVVKPAPKPAPRSPTPKASVQNEKSSRPVKKVVLKPKHKLKKIEPVAAFPKKVVNKRKRTQPQKQVNPDAPLKSWKEPQKSTPKAEVKSAASSPGSTESSRSLKRRCLEDERLGSMSFSEVVRLRERTEELTDDDLLEIVQCPSPVWWEDPPDELYDEDPISERSATLQTESEALEKKPVATDIDNRNASNCKPENQSSLNVLRIPDSNCDQGFVKKRSALETILVGIKVGKNIDNVSNKSISINQNKGNLEKAAPETVSCSKGIDLKETENDKIPKLEKTTNIKRSIKATEAANIISIVSNLATPTSNIALEMKRKMDAHIPKIRNVTADCMKSIRKGITPLNVKKVYSGNDSAELIPTKSNRRLDIFIDLSEEAEGDGTRSIDIKSDVISTETTKIAASCEDGPSESQEHEDDILKDLENLLIPIAPPTHDNNSECIVIDEDEGVSEKNESFLGVNESVKTQPVSDLEFSAVDVNTGSEKSRGIFSTPGSRHIEKMSPISCDKTSYIINDNEPKSKPIEFVKPVKRYIEKDKEDPLKVRKLIDITGNPPLQNILSTDTVNLCLGIDQQIDSNSSSDCEKGSNMISDTNIKCFHEDQLLDDPDRKLQPSQSVEDESTESIDGKNDLSVGKMTSTKSKIQQAYCELITNLRTLKSLNYSSDKLANEKSAPSLVTTIKCDKQEIITLNSSSDNITDTDDIIDDNNAETKATIQVFDSTNIEIGIPITYEVVTSETKLLESLKAENWNAEDNKDESETFKLVDVVKADYDREGESDDETCDYEQISKIPMSREMIANIIGVEDSKDMPSDAETLEKIVLHGFNPKNQLVKPNIVIAQKENVKYCFSCSSIYDTDECRYCQKKTSSNKNIVKVFACMKCHYRSKKRSNMEAHALTHTKEKPFSCDLCKASFKTKATLKNHLSKYCCNSPSRKSRCSEQEQGSLQYTDNSQEEILVNSNEIIVILAES